MDCSACGQVGATVCSLVDPLGQPAGSWYHITCYAQRGVYPEERLDTDRLPGVAGPHGVTGATLHKLWPWPRVPRQHTQRSLHELCAPLRIGGVYRCDHDVHRQGDARPAAYPVRVHRFLLKAR